MTVDHFLGNAIRLGKGHTKHIAPDRATQQFAETQQRLATASGAMTILAFTDNFAVGAQDCSLKANQISIEPKLRTHVYRSSV